MKRKFLILAMVMIMVIPILSGCIVPEYESITVRGGGWLLAPGMIAAENDNNPKATFGFTVECYNFVYDNEELESWDVRGNFVYNDHLNGIRIKGEILNTMYYEDDTVFSGTCILDGVECNFDVSVMDEGEPGTGDYFMIAVEFEDTLLYKNEGTLGGGNIQIRGF